MWQILEKMAEDRHDTYHLFIDFKAAYDSIASVKLYDAMSSFGIPGKLIRLVRMTMKNFQGLLLPIKGLRPEDGLDCLLFNLALERAIRDIIGPPLCSQGMVQASENLGLQINDSKTKLMVAQQQHQQS